MHSIGNASILGIISLAEVVGMVVGVVVGMVIGMVAMMAPTDIVLPMPVSMTIKPIPLIHISIILMPIS